MYICIDWQLVHDFVFQEMHFHEWEYGLACVPYATTREYASRTIQFEDYECRKTDSEDQTETTFRQM